MSLQQHRTQQHRTQLRPLSTVEILDAAAVMLRRQWGVWLSLSSVGTLPLCVLVLIYFQWAGTLLAGTEPAAFYLGTFWWALGMTGAWTVNMVARAALTASALGAVKGEELTPQDAWRAAWKSAVGSAFVGLTSFSAAWLLGGCALVPGVLLACAWWVARPVMLAEDRPFAAALRRSVKLTSGYRSRAFGLWLFTLAMWGITALNLHLLMQFLLDTGSQMLGVDTSSAKRFLHPGNLTYLTFLMAVAFTLLDPLKTAMDTLFYLDVRVRREGVDLQERLRALGAGAALFLAVLVGGAGLASARPAAAETVEQYAGRLRELRQAVEKAPNAGAVPPDAMRGAREMVVTLPGGQKLSVENDGLARSVGGWKTPEEKAAVLRRLEGLERSLGPAAVTASPDPAAGPATAGPAGGPVPAAAEAKESLQQLLTEPEFQPLAERTEVRDLMKSVKLPDTKNWWQAFWKWIQNNLFKPPKLPQAPTPPRGPAWNTEWVMPALYVLLGGVALFLVALIIKWIIERPLKDTPVEAGRAIEPQELEQASATENALDHTVDEWELFAQQWLGRGDVRQAVRALYLATLVHLHRERRIEYNRALTNWIYVRQFRGEAEQKSVFQRLTRTFDEVWYGERGLGEELYRTFEQGVRALGTPAPTARPGAPLPSAGRPTHG